jgi:hypothetical protein
MNSIQIQTNPPKTLNLKLIDELTKDYRNNLMNQYNNHYNNERTLRPLGNVEIQMILSFVYPKSRTRPPWFNQMRILGTSPQKLPYLEDIAEKKDIAELEGRYGRTQNAYNYCVNCKKFKRRNQMTEKF